MCGTRGSIAGHATDQATMLGGCNKSAVVYMYLQILLTCLLHYTCAVQGVTSHLMYLQTQLTFLLHYTYAVCNKPSNVLTNSTDLLVTLHMCRTGCNKPSIMLTVPPRVKMSGVDIGTLLTLTCKKCNLMIPSFRTNRSKQTVQTRVRLLLEEHSDQGLHC